MQKMVKFWMVWTVAVLVGYNLEGMPFLVLMGIAFITSHLYHAEWKRPAWTYRKRDDLTSEEEDEMVAAINRHFEIEEARNATPPFRKWSEAADLLSHRFLVAGRFGGITNMGPGLAMTYREVIMMMGKHLDRAVDNGWAALPDDEFIKRTAHLRVGKTAQNEVKDEGA